VRRLFTLMATLSLLEPLGVASATQANADDLNDEIHYSYGTSPAQVVFDWRGPDSTISYGTDTTYGQTVTASAPGITPVDIPGPFWEATLAVSPGSTYHYRIGLGPDHTFTSVPSGSFRWVDEGDNGTTLCESWEGSLQGQIAAEAPNVVTHGGDLSYANECGNPAVHQFFLDQEVWSHSAAFEPVWGNHEYGAPSSTAPAGTIRDSLANYKGRFALTNPQTVPNDTINQTTNPGCTALAGTITNSCQGEDWGWFKAGGVLFVSYPEPWPNAIANWRVKADALMAQAQADPSIDYVVTYGHRPAYTSQATNGSNPGTKDAIDALGDRYSPNATPGGKYVLSIGHHAHGEEAFSAQHGIVHLTNGGGGAGQTYYSSTAVGSLFKSVHPGFLSADYSAVDHTLDVRLICGPQYGSSTKDPCAQGSTLYHVQITQGPLPSPLPMTDYFSSCDTSVEAGLSCFGTRYNSNSVVSLTTEQAYAGTHAERISASASSGGIAGFTAKVGSAYPVTSTVADRTYSGGVWTKASVVGQKITLALKERRADGTSPGAVSLPWTSTDLAWHHITAAYTAKEAGNALVYSLYSPNLLNASDPVYADSMSLTSAG